jgi:hypothetical protein
MENKSNGNVITRLFDLLREGSVNYAIANSGSVKGRTNEKNRAGQAYLYKRLGLESEVFEIKMNGRVYTAALQQAVNTALRRYPYLTVKFAEKDGDFYFIENTIPLIVKETSTLRPLGGLKTNYHLIDVTCKGNSIFVSFHHALCDGEGIKPFIETLLYYYCQTRYNNMRKKPIPGIRLANEALLEGETKDPFLEIYEVADSKPLKLSRDGFALDENVKIDGDTYYRYELLVGRDEFLAFAKANNATPSIALGLVMNQAIKNLYPDFDKPIICNMALNIRRALACENTFKNCVKSVSFPYLREFSELPLSEQATEYRRLLDIQRSEDYVKKEVNGMVGLFQKLDELRSYDEKKQVMSFFEDTLLNTYVTSYVGQFNLGYNEERVESIHLYNSGTTGLGISMCAAGKYFALDFKQSFPSDRYVTEFTAVMRSRRLDCKVSECIEFKTPTDSLMKRRKSAESRRRAFVSGK